MALFASGKNPAAYRATIVQAPWAGDKRAGVSEMMKQGGHITSRILLQHGSNDTVAPVQISRTLFSSLKQQGKAVEYEEYDPPSMGTRSFQRRTLPYGVLMWSGTLTGCSLGVAIRFSGQWGESGHGENGGMHGPLPRSRMLSE